MANPEHLAILKQGVAAWNEWRLKTAERADLSGADFSGLSLISANLSETDLSGSNLNNADLDKADLSRAHLRRTNLNAARLCNANLMGANLRGAKLNEASIKKSNLNKAILIDAKLVGAHLIEANLSGADLTRADLIRSDFIQTNLCDANLCDASLRGAILIEANLNSADLCGADLVGANLNRVSLSSTDLTAIVLGFTIFADVDLSATIGIETAEHRRPSTIGIDSLYRSRGKIPHVFLRGCGVPDSFIDQAKALIGAEEGIQFYSCFISYSGLDEDFARRLHGRLQQEHVRVWFAPHDIQGGKKLHEQIDEAIKVYDKLLILLSPNSLKSEWVMTELRKARKAERKMGKRKLFPVGMVDYATLQEWECFDADGGKDLAVEVREYFIPDFSNWKDHDAFEKGFARLLKDLRAEEKAVG